MRCVLELNSPRIWAFKKRLLILWNIGEVSPREQFTNVPLRGRNGRHLGGLWATPCDTSGDMHRLGVTPTSRRMEETCLWNEPVLGETRVEGWIDSRVVKVTVENVAQL
jgi:hypothetical protein